MTPNYPTLRRAALALALVPTLASTLCALSFPPGSGVINVRTDLTTYDTNPSLAGIQPIHTSNATGNGSTDDTAAIQAAINFTVESGNRYFRPYIIYLPTGTYRLTNQLASKSLDTSFSNGWRSGMILMGESRTGTILKLDNDRTGFQTTTSPKGLIITGSENPVSSADGGGNQAFRHQIVNLTVDVGSGNEGAVGIDFNASNRGTVRDVIIRTSGSNRVGVNGLRLKKSGDGIGPCLIKNVTIDGFSTGIYAGTFDYSVTFEDITLQNQLSDGIVNDNAALFIRRLTSSINKPVIRNRQGAGHVVLLDSSLNGGSSGVSAIVNSGTLFVRDSSATGFGTVIDNLVGTGADVSGGSGTTKVGEFVSHAVESEFTTNKLSLRLPVEETPDYQNTNFSGDWVSVTSYGATRDNSSDDDRAAIQAAIDSGKKVVYFPQGSYHVSGPIYVRNNVLKMVGFEAVVIKKSGYTNYDLVRFDSPNTVINERLNWRGNTTHNSSGTWVFRHCDFQEDGAATFKNNAAGNSGKTFIEDCIAPKIRLTGGHRLWGRQVNCEHSILSVSNDASFIWMLGFKTESSSATKIENKNGAFTEILGGYFFANNTQTNSSIPMVLNDNANLAMTYVQSRSQWTTQVTEKRGSTTSSLTRSEVPTRGDGTIVGLYVGYQDLPARDDSYTFDGSTGSNYGTESSMVVKATTTSGFNRRSYIKFNLNGLSSSVGSATLSLITKSVQSGVSASSPVTIQLYKVDDNWSETSLTWSNQPGFSGSPIATATVTGANQEITFNVTSAVNAEISGDKSVSFCITQSTSTNKSVEFDTREAVLDMPLLQLSETGGGSALQASEGAYVHDGTASSNYGSSADLLVKHTSTPGYTRVGLLKFDLSAQSSVAAATLSLVTKSVQSGVSSSNPVTIYVYRSASDAWSEGAVTWNNQPGSSGSPLASATVTGANQEITFDLTSVVNTEIAGDGQLSLYVRQANNTNKTIVFHSDEASSNQPLLELL